MNKPSNQTFEQMVEEAAQKYQDEDFKNNPDGYHVAPYVNNETTSTAFEAGAKFAEANAQHMPKVKALIEALEKNKLEWEAVNPNGHKHMVAWQMTRDALEALSEEKI